VLFTADPQDYGQVFLAEGEHSQKGAKIGEWKTDKTS